MDSASKITLTHNQINTLCRYALGKGAADSREITHGWFNTIHHIQLDDGTSTVLKVSPHPDFKAMRYETDIMHTEVRVLRLLGTKSLPAPQVLAFHESGPGLPHPFFFMEYLDGCTWGSRKGELREALKTAAAQDARSMQDDLDRMDRTLGHLSAEVNNCGPGFPQVKHRPLFGPLAWGESSPDNWYDALIRMVQDLLEDARDTGTPLPLRDEEIIELFASHKDILQKVRVPALVLWDFHDGNLMVTPPAPAASDSSASPLAGTTRVAGILDCDRALLGDPLMEFWFRTMAGSSQSFLQAWADSISWDIMPGASRMPAIQTGAQAPDIITRIRLYDLYLALVMRIECSFRGFASGHTDWTRDCLQKAIESLKCP